MDFEGRFTTPDSLGDVMRRASAEALTGTLGIRCGQASVASFSFHRGKLTGSDNPERHRRLGRILLNRGQIDRAGLEEALAYQRDFAAGTPIGRVLVHRGKLSQDELREAVRIQLEDELSSALTCTEGFYVFNAAEPDPEDTPLVQIDTEAVVNETLGRVDEWNRIREKLPDDNVIPSVVKLNSPADREILHLTSREWHILSLINGYYNVGAIATRSGLGRFDTYKILENLLANGVIGIRTPAEPTLAFASDSAPVTSTPQENSAKLTGSSSSRWGNILSRLRDEAENPSRPASTALEFDSPVSFLAQICNQVTDKLMLNPDFVLDPSDEKLAERIWRQILMTYPRADLVTAHLNTLQTAGFERYTRTLGVEGPMRSIYLDTVDALARFLRSLYLLSAQRIGSRAARMVFVDVMDNVRSRSSIAHSDNFFFKDMAAEILA